MKGIPWTLIVACIGLTILGLIGLSRADELYGQTVLPERQFIWFLLGLVTCFGMTFLPYRRIRPWSGPLFVVAVLLLLLVLFMPLRNGARRWIPLGLLYFQPSELARPAFIMAMASCLMHRRTERRLGWFLPPLLLTFIPMVLILREPDLGTTLLFLPVMYAMLFCSGADPRRLAASVVVGILLLPVLWQQMNAEQRSRVVAVFAQSDSGRPVPGDGFHLNQSKQILALGGLRGSFAEPTPLMEDASVRHLPAARTDFIFCMIGERFGLTGCLLVLALYGTILVSGLRIARRTREPWGQLTAVGITAMISVQALINTGMTVGLFPITGITLPLCSYGGSSLIATYASVGLLSSIARHPGYEVTDIPFRPPGR